MTDYSYLSVTSQDEKLSFRVRFGEGDVKPLGGGAGWESVARPKKRALTVWRGPTESYGYEVPLLFDVWTNPDPTGYYSAYGVEGDLRTLEKMAGINVQGDPKPPVLILEANGALPHDFTNAPQNLWVIPETPDYGEALRRRSDGKRVRQVVTVKFIIYTVDDSLSREQQVKTLYTTARSGDTYEKIAARKLHPWGGKRLGNRLAQLNNARDGAAKVPAGTPVLLPTPKLIEEWRRKPRR